MIVAVEILPSSSQTDNTSPHPYTPNPPVTGLASSLKPPRAAKGKLPSVTRRPPVGGEGSDEGEDEMYACLVLMSRGVADVW